MPSSRHFYGVTTALALQNLTDGGSNRVRAGCVACDTPENRPRTLWGGDGTAESDGRTAVGTAPALDIALETPGGAAEIGRERTLPGSPAQDVPAAGGRPSWRCPGGCFIIIAHGRHLAPFPHVAHHVAYPKRADVAGVRTDRSGGRGMRALAAIFRHPGITPRPGASIDAARRFFPLGFRRDDGLRPGGVVENVRPTHVHHRVVVLPAPLRGRRHSPSGCFTTGAELRHGDRVAVHPEAGKPDDALWFFLGKPIRGPLRLLLQNSNNIGITGPHGKGARGNPCHLGAIDRIQLFIIIR